MGIVGWIRGFEECQGVGRVGWLPGASSSRGIRGGGSAQGSGWVSALLEYMTGAVGIMGNAVITA